jgi:hypothetical protein
MTNFSLIQAIILIDLRFRISHREATMLVDHTILITCFLQLVLWKWRLETLLQPPCTSKMKAWSIKARLEERTKMNLFSCTWTELQWLTPLHKRCVLLKSVEVLESWVCQVIIFVIDDESEIAPREYSMSIKNEAFVWWHPACTFKHTDPSLYFCHPFISLTHSYSSSLFRRRMSQFEIQTEMAIHLGAVEPHGAEQQTRMSG